MMTRSRFAGALVDQGVGKGDRVIIYMPMVPEAVVVNERGLIGPAVLDVPIQRVVAGVDHASRVPAIERGPRSIEHTFPWPVPVDGFASLGPEPLGVFAPLRVDVVLGAWTGARAGCGVHKAVLQRRGPVRYHPSR